MKKKVIVLLLIVLSLSLVVAFCFMLRNKNNQTDVTEITDIVGESVEYEDVYLFGENNKHFTNDNLPDEYKNSDFDSDELKNKDEIEYGTNMYKVDTDNDGISDYDEVNKTKTDPTKWSSRDDEMSDLEYSIINQGGFKEEYTYTDANGFKIYLSKPEDRLCVISKTSTNVFDDLETISEAFQIKYFSGQVALNCNKYIEEVANSIAIYKDVNGVATKIESSVDKDNLVVFKLDENDVFVLVYEPNN